MIAVDGQPGSHFSQDLARIVVYELAASSEEHGHGHHLDDCHWVHRGVIAKFLMPGKNEPAGFILTTIWVSSARSWRPISVRLWAGMGRMKAPDLLARSLEP